MCKFSDTKQLLWEKVKKKVRIRKRQENLVRVPRLIGMKVNYHLNKTVVTYCKK